MRIMQILQLELANTNETLLSYLNKIYTFTMFSLFVLFSIHVLRHHTCWCARYISACDL